MYNFKLHGVKKLVVNYYFTNLSDTNYSHSTYSPNIKKNAISVF